MEKPLSKKAKEQALRYRNQKRAREIERQRRREAKARRKVNKYWQYVETSDKYRKAVRIESYECTTRKIQAEVMDGLLLNLNERNSDKSLNVQLRLLRRIVEKRQAQALHQKSSHDKDRLSLRATICNSSKCMTDLRNLRMGKGRCMRKYQLRYA